MTAITLVTVSAPEIDTPGTVIPAANFAVVTAANVHHPTTHPSSRFGSTSTTPVPHRHNTCPSSLRGNNGFSSSIVIPGTIAPANARHPSTRRRISRRGSTGSTCVNTQTISQHSSPVRNTTSCRSVINKDIVHVTASPSTSPEPSEPSPALYPNDPRYCYCDRPSDIDCDHCLNGDCSIHAYVQCSGPCDMWFHPECAGWNVHPNDNYDPTHIVPGWDAPTCMSIALSTKTHGEAYTPFWCIKCYGECTQVPKPITNTEWLDLSLHEHML
jgi:hypothetical protein